MLNEVRKCEDEVTRITQANSPVDVKEINFAAKPTLDLGESYIKIRLVVPEGIVKSGPNVFAEPGIQD